MQDETTYLPAAPGPVGLLLAQPPVPSPPSPVPQNVILAFRFVEMSNHFMVPRVVRSPLDDENEELDCPSLAPMHEMAFDRACEVLCNYFSDTEIRHADQRVCGDDRRQGPDLLSQMLVPSAN